MIGDLTPLVPLSFEGEGEIIKEGLSPLLDILINRVRLSASSDV